MRGGTSPSRPPAVCSGTGVGATGVCQCVDGWSARACTQPAYRLVNCTPSDTADIITAEFVNGAANPLRATTCAGTKCTSATAHPCAEVLPQHASMTLWMPGATTRLVVQVCNPGASSNASCTDLTQEFTLSAGVWSPPLELPHTSQVYCEDMDDCDGQVRWVGPACDGVSLDRRGSLRCVLQELCLPNHQGLGEPWNVCVGTLPSRWCCKCCCCCCCYLRCSHVMVSPAPQSAPLCPRGTSRAVATALASHSPQAWPATAHASAAGQVRHATCHPTPL